ncbi:MAG: GTP-binding protein [Clostridia bacterium]|nr:GTP-binding protein [Clostridia bacterium]
MLKIDIISGFLGAGKTTLIKKLLSSALKGQKIVLIENEFGDIGIDGGFLKEAGVQINEMNSGCICCSLVGDFKKALNKVYQEYKPERIIIEPSGVGKLSDVLQAVLSAQLPDSQISSLTAVVDAKKCKMYMKNFGEFYKNQIVQAKCVVLSHTTGIDADKLQYCLDMVKELNEHAVIVTTPWEELKGEQIFDAMTNVSSLNAQIKELEEAEVCPVCGGHHHHDHEHEHHHEHDEECSCGHHQEHEHEHEHDQHHEHGEECSCGHHHEHDHEHEHEHHHHEHGEECGCGHHHEHEHHHHHADEVFSSWGKETTCKYTVEKVKEILSSLDSKEYGDILRAKGIVSGDNGEWIHFDYVPEEVDVRLGSSEVIGRICVIGCALDEEKLAKLFGVK